MKKNGFTLIELLAVIVILAIIAIIATPIILNTINDTKESAARVSFQNYIRAVDLAIAKKELTEEKVVGGEYDIREEGKLLVLQVDSNNKIDVEFEGEAPTGDTITIENGKVTTGSVKIGGYEITYENGTITDMAKIGSQEEKEYIKVTLVTGQNFNSKIKTLANNGETVAHDTEDTKVTSIEFYSNGKLPKGYSKTKLNNITSKVDVSKDNDGSIMAYYEEGKVYVVSDNLISLNSDSSDMFLYFKSVTNIVFTNGKYNMADTSKVTRMTQMFKGCSSLTELDVSNFDTNQVTSMYAMFNGCSGLTSLDVSNFDTSKVTIMGNMFTGCSSLTELDVSKWNTSQVTSMYEMFHGCNSLKELDVSNFNTNQVTSMYAMFNGCSGLTSLDVSNFNTNQVTIMGNMFSGCSSLTELDVSKWNTSQVTSMGGMFNKCSGLTSLDVSNFNTNQVTSMYQMFKDTKNLNTIIIGCDWVIAPANMDMFTGSGYTLDKLNTQIEEIKPACPVVNAN